MKKLDNIIILISALLLSFAMLSGCSKEEDRSALEESSVVFFHAVTESGGTKTVLENGDSETESHPVLWTPGDAIWVGTADASGKYVYEGTEETAYADFGGTLLKGSTYYSIYPYSEEVYMSDGILFFEMPHVQKYTPLSFGPAASPMVAVSSSTTLRYKNLCGLLKLNLLGEETIQSISFSARDAAGNSIMVAGRAKVDMGYLSVPELVMDQYANPSVILDCGEGVTLSNTEVTPFYMVLPPGTYEEFSLIIVTTDGKVMVKKSNNLEINRSRVKPTAELTFEESGLIELDGRKKLVHAEGGEVTLEFEANIETEVIIQEDAQDWIKVIPDTRAMQRYSVTLWVDPNTAEERRTALVEVRAVDGQLSIMYEIEQLGCKEEIEIDPDAVPDNEIWYVTKNKIKASFSGQEFDASIVSHTYEEGKWVIKFDAPVTKIEWPSFINTNDIITGLFLPDCMTHINNIGGNFELTEFRIPKSLKSLKMPGNSLNNSGTLQQLTGYNVSEDGHSLVIDGVLVWFVPGELAEYTTPNGIISIGQQAFRGCKTNKIIIAEGVTTIQMEAFWGEASFLEEVFLPESLQYIEAYAFARNSKIKRFYGPSRFVSEDGMCLYVDNYNSSGLRNLVSFASGAGLTSYEIPNGIEGIENYSIYYADELRELTIPETVKEIGSVAFEGTYNIERLYGPNVLDDGRSYAVDNKLLYVADKGIVEYVVPENVTVLGYQVFGQKQHLENIVMTDNVISVEVYGYLFNDSPNLKTVTISARMKNLGWDPFKGSPKLESVYLRAPIPPSVYHNSAESIPTEFENLTIYVPEESLDAYMSSSYWEPYQGYLEGYDYGDLSEFYPDVYTSTDYSADGQVELLQSATVGNGIDIVLMGDAYSDRLIADGTYRSVMVNTMEQFFSQEPYKSFRDYFNVYMVNVVSPNEVYEEGSRTALSTWFGGGTSVGGDDQTVFNYALKAITSDRLDEALLVVMMNRDYYAGTCWMYYPSEGDYGNGVSVAYFPTSSDEATFRGLILHEAGGHGFSKLADEYAYESMGQIPGEEVTNCMNLWDFGWYKNIDFTSDPTLVNWAKFITDERYQYDGLGVFEGGYTYWTSVWRPTENSIMRYNEGDFNAPSRECIYIRIHKLAFGADWQYDYEEFVAYDAVNRRTSPMTAPSYVLRRNEPTAPPVIVRKTWREVMDE